MSSEYILPAAGLNYKAATPHEITAGAVFDNIGRALFGYFLYPSKESNLLRVKLF